MRLFTFTVYQGEFKAGHRHGQGMYRFADGSVYTGEWKNGKYDGVGEVSKRRVSECGVIVSVSLGISSYMYMQLITICFLYSAAGRMAEVIAVNGRMDEPMVTE